MSALAESISQRPSAPNANPGLQVIRRSGN
jgi:hypothetical protein